MVGGGSKFSEKKKGKADLQVSSAKRKAQGYSDGVVDNDEKIPR